MAGRIMYDIQAGETLYGLLVQLNDKLAGLARYRQSQKTANLDCTPGAWLGTESDKFHDAFPTHQSYLGDFAEQALRAQALVNTANQGYYTGAAPNQGG